MRANPKRKIFTPEEIARKQQKAVRFLRDVVGDDELADEIESLTLEDYAERKRIELANFNPVKKGGGTSMPRKPTRGELLEENETLWSTLENIYDELGDLLDEEKEEEAGDQD